VGAVVTEDAARWSEEACCFRSEDMRSFTEGAASLPVDNYQSRVGRRQKAGAG